MELTEDITKKVDEVIIEMCNETLKAKEDKEICWWVLVPTLTRLLNAREGINNTKCCQCDMKTDNIIKEIAEKLKKEIIHF